MVSVRVQHEPALVEVNGMEHVIRPLILKVPNANLVNSSLGYKFQDETGRVSKSLVAPGAAQDATSSAVNASDSW
jgi:hypothetical protein